MAAPKTSETAETRFPQYAAYQKLADLAEHPLDMTKEGVITPERINSMIAESCGYRFLYGTERVTPDVMSALKSMADEAQAVKKMNDMQNGEVVNYIEGFPSDNRAVLHTAMRDFFENPHTQPKAKEAAELAKQEHAKLKRFLDKIDAEKRYTDLIAVAIGGSDLGPKALYLSLQHLRRPGRNVHFISNIDPDAVSQVLRDIDLSKALVVVVSKSGTTLETVSNEAMLRKHYVAAGLDPDKHFVSVTAKGSPMDTTEHYIEAFHMWDYVGGRFSATSMGGALTLAFAYGYDVLWDLLKGANAMDKAACKNDLNTNLPLLGALLSIWNHNFLGYPTLAFVPYSEQLFRFPAHIQQVVMESNGKRIDHRGVAVDFDTGPIVWGEPGTSAQHSFYQLIHQGTDPVPLELVGFKESAYGQDLEVQGTTSQEKLLSNLFAQALALAVGRQHENPNKVFPGNRPSHILLGKKLTPFALGALFAYIEHKVVFEGFIWDINSFDQEGVELGKVLANKILSIFAGKESFPVGKAFIDQLSSL
ncbi:MAG: glucose-6-phosphate isomerase [Chlamydiales bacterium]|nr:glucose-6-phosphate isomerase [Chlamydiales bacterium]